MNELESVFRERFLVCLFVSWYIYINVVGFNNGVRVGEKFNGIKFFESQMMEREASYVKSVGARYPTSASAPPLWQYVVTTWVSLIIGILILLALYFGFRNFMGTGFHSLADSTASYTAYYGLEVLNFVLTLGPYAPDILRIIYVVVVSFVSTSFMYKCGIQSGKSNFSVHSAFKQSGFSYTKSSYDYLLVIAGVVGAIGLLGFFGTDLLSMKIFDMTIAIPQTAGALETVSRIQFYIPSLFLAFLMRKKGIIPILLILMVSFSCATCGMTKKIAVKQEADTPLDIQLHEGEPPKDEPPKVVPPKVVPPTKVTEPVASDPLIDFEALVDFTSSGFNVILWTLLSFILLIIFVFQSFGFLYIPTSHTVHSLLYSWSGFSFYNTEAFQSYLNKYEEVLGKPKRYLSKRGTLKYVKRVRDPQSIVHSKWNALSHKMRSAFLNVSNVQFKNAVTEISKGRVADYKVLEILCNNMVIDNSGADEKKFELFKDALRKVNSGITEFAETEVFDSSTEFVWEYSTIVCCVIQILSVYGLSFVMLANATYSPAIRQFMWVPSILFAFYYTYLTFHKLYLSVPLLKYSFREIEGIADTFDKHFNHVISTQPGVQSIGYCRMDGLNVWRLLYTEIVVNVLLALWVHTIDCSILYVNQRLVFRICLIVALVFWTMRDKTSLVSRLINLLPIWHYVEWILENETYIITYVRNQNPTFSRRSKGILYNDCHGDFMEATAPAKNHTCLPDISQVRVFGHVVIRCHCGAKQDKPPDASEAPPAIHINVGDDTSKSGRVRRDATSSESRPRRRDIGAVFEGQEIPYFEQDEH